MTTVRIYEQSKSQLKDLLKDAASIHGARLIIPDLQRPYVWTPAQVVLLVDSLVKGWPFGTLLLWTVSSNEMTSIPSRTFWSIVDRTHDEASQPLPKATPPADFLMVLDGQQRMQSLLLALIGDDWGFKLPDRAWAAALEWDNVPAGSHWSRGSLSLNLKKFHAAYKEVGNVVWIDFRDVLEWTVDTPIGGISEGNRPANYTQPLKASREFPGTYIRLSRLWSIASSAYGVAAGKLKSDLTALLDKHGVPAGEQVAIQEPLLALLESFAGLKTTEVGFLRLLGYDPETFEESHYNDAIVNIFTRLNTAGRTLTRQEITFAWIKRQWDPANTGGRWAPECFEGLREFLDDRDLSIDMDDVVKGVSTVWSVAFGGGALLSDKDLLKAQKLKPLAADLSTRWALVEEVIHDITETLGTRGLEYQRHYRSLNAVFILWAWRTLAELWVQVQKPRALEEDSFRKSVAASLTTHVDRWMLLTQWAGRWASSTDKELARCVKELAMAWSSISVQTDPEKASASLGAVLARWIDEARPDAITHIEALGVSDRKQVRFYFSPLWVWHRLNPERWAASSIPLRAGKRKTSKLDVDHVVAYALWQKWPDLDQSPEDRERVINSVGNCVLLEKTFNISKGTQTLQEFMSQTYEVKNELVDLKTWLPRLDLQPELASPTADSVDVVIQGIREREATIKRDLTDYVRGIRERVDPIGELKVAVSPPIKLRDEKEGWRTHYRTRYWSGFAEYLRSSPNAVIQLAKPPRAGAAKIHTFREGASLKVYCSTDENKPGIYLGLKGPTARTTFVALREAAAKIEQDVGVPLFWQVKTENSNYHIVAAKEDGVPGAVNEEEWRRQFEWLHGMAKRFIEVFSPRLKALV